MFFSFEAKCSTGFKAQAASRGKIKARFCTKWQKSRSRQPRRACLHQPALSRRNVSPHLQIRCDSCKLRGGRWAAIFTFHSARPKPERGRETPSLSLFLIYPEGAHPVGTSPLWPAGETSGSPGAALRAGGRRVGGRHPSKTRTVKKKSHKPTGRHGSAVLQQRLRPQVWRWQQQGRWDPACFFFCCFNSDGPAWVCQLL